MRLYHLISCIVAFALFSCENKVSDPLFELIPASELGIDFNNEIIETPDFYPSTFIYIYNGAGIGVLDVNNDGLQDLFFAGNNVDSKLYLNQGDLQFKDITANSGIADSKYWATGVSVVDINADGFQDIYVNVADRESSEASRNKLFINQGDNTFKEQAATYGLDDDGYSTQTAFFDYDNDGDLDAYVLTNAIENFSHNNIRPRQLTGKGKSTDRLYENDGNGHFTNVSEKAGITVEGYGLGIAIVDINQDGFDDVYCSNDFITNDLLWVNNGDGTFTENLSTYISQTSYNGMGIDIADFNNDAVLDIVQVDMLPEENHHHKTMTPAMDYNHQSMRYNLGYNAQYVRNTLQLGHKGAGFSEVGRLAEVHKTDWSWAPLFLDFDNDGDKDLFISNGYGRDVTDLDYASYAAQESNNPFGTPEARAKRQYEGFDKLGPINLPNYFYTNDATIDFNDVANQIENNQPSISNGAVYADLDNDGDIEIVVSNLNQTPFIYKNLAQDSPTPANYLSVSLKQEGANANAVGASITVYAENTIQNFQNRPVRGYKSSVDSRINIGLAQSSKVDSIMVSWPGTATTEKFEVNQLNTQIFLQKGKGKQVVLPNTEQNTLFTQTELAIAKHTENNFIDFLDNPLLLKMLSKEGPSIAVADVNKDGRDDFVMGAAYQDTTWVYQQSLDGEFIKAQYLEDSWKHEDAGIAIFDVDGDGLQDIYIGSGGFEFAENSSSYSDRLYKQQADGTFIQVNDFQNGTESTGPVVIADFDADGDIDVFVGTRVKPRNYPMAGSSKLWVNENGRLIDKTDALTKGFDKLHHVTAAVWSDYNNDGSQDLIVVGEWMAPAFFANKNGQLVYDAISTEKEELLGLWNSIQPVDIDNDGDIDYVLGNYGLNTDLKATPDEPVTLLAKDFDGNGDIDPILGHYSQGSEYPYPSRDALASQIVAMKKRFPSYKKYAEVDYDGLFTDKEKEGALELELNCSFCSFNK